MKFRKYLFYTLITALLISIALVLHTELTENDTDKSSVFVYGTLKNPLVRLYACACLTSETPAILSGYRKEGLNIVLDSSSTVEGEILEVSQVELKRFDRYEDTPNNYRRRQVIIGDSTVWVYVKN